MRKVRILPPNYTQVPNILFEIMHDLKEAELRVILAVARKTFGWHKKTDRISFSQMMKMTGLSHRGVWLGVRDAEARGLLLRTKGKRNIGVFEIRVHEPKVTSKPGISRAVNVMHRTSKPSISRSVNVVATQNKQTKKTFQKKDEQQQSTDADAVIAPQSNADQILSGIGIGGSVLITLAKAVAPGPPLPYPMSAGTRATTDCRGPDRGDALPHRAQTSSQKRRSAA